MTRKIMVALLVVSLFLLVSCGTGGTERGFGRRGSNVNADEDFLKGTRGLDIKLADPDVIVVPEEQSAQFDLIVENMGRSNIEGGKILLSGFDEKFIKFLDNQKKQEFNINGKNRYGPGGQVYVLFKSEKTKLSGTSVASFGPGSGIERLEQPVTVNVCTKEVTSIQIPICVDLDPLRDGKCPTEVTKSFSEGQGAPVGLVSMTQKSYRKDNDEVRLNLDFTFEQFDKSNDAMVFDKEIELCTTGSMPPDLYQKQDDVSFTFRSDFGVGMTCPGLTHGTKTDYASQNYGSFDLVRRPTIRCYVDVPITGEYLNSVLDFSLEYKMWYKVTQPIVIEKY